MMRSGTTKRVASTTAPATVRMAKSGTLNASKPAAHSTSSTNAMSRTARTASGSPTPSAGNTTRTQAVPAFLSVSWI